MATPVVDYLKQDSDMTMHDHTEADLGAILDSRYIKVAGGNSASNIIIENDTSDGDITFKVNDGGVDKTVMTLDGATGCVGIGTTSPTALFQVAGKGAFGDSITSSNAPRALNLISTNATMRILRVSADIATASPGVELIHRIDPDGTSDSYWDFFTGSSDSFNIRQRTSGDFIRLKIDSAGKVAIGLNATSPSATLHVGNRADDIGMIVKGYVGQTQNLQEWRDNSNNKLAVVNATGYIGVGTTSPTNMLSLGGNSARIFWLERHTTANTAGNTLTVTAGGSTSGATDKAGGALILQGGLSTGSAESGVTIQGCVAGASGTTDRTQTTMIQVLGNKLSFYNQTPVVRPTALTPTGTYVLNTGDAGSDTEITLMRTRINELESKLQGLGLLT